MFDQATMPSLRVPKGEAFTRKGCSFRGGATGIDFCQLAPIVQNNPLEVVVLNDTPISVSGRARPAFFHCISGVLEDGGSNLHLQAGDFFFQESDMEDSLSLYARGERALLAVVALPPVTPSPVPGTIQPQNVSETPYQPRPNGITLKSLLVGTPYEAKVGYEFVEMPRNSTIDIHLHPQSDAIVFVTRGSGSFLLGDAEVLVTPGVHGFIARGQKHGVRSESEGMDFISVQVPPIGGKNGYVFYSKPFQPVHQVRLD